MQISKRHSVALILSLLLLVTACHHHYAHPGAPSEPVPEPAVPAGYQKIAPAPVDDSSQMLRQTAAIIRGTLKEVRFTYEQCAGPRTTYVFSDATPLAGSAVPANVTLNVLGGPTPRGTWVSVSELPRLALDSQYIIFLRNTDWTFSPIVGNLVFRVENVSGREVLVDPTGRAVTGWAENGPVLSASQVSDNVGLARIGFRKAESRSQTPPPMTGPAQPEPKIEKAQKGVPPPPSQKTDQDFSFADAPSPADIRTSGMFAKPALDPAAIANEKTIASAPFIDAVKAAATQSRLEIGGRVTLNPFWRCWNITPTARVLSRQPIQR